MSGLLIRIVVELKLVNAFKKDAKTIQGYGGAIPGYMRQYLIEINGRRFVELEGGAFMVRIFCEVSKDIDTVDEAAAFVQYNLNRYITITPNQFVRDNG